MILLPIVNKVDDSLTGKVDLEPYTEHDFHADMERTTQGRHDRHLGHVLISESNATISGWPL